jgi:hypothetical protein
MRAFLHQSLFLSSIEAIWAADKGGAGYAIVSSPSGSDSGSRSNENLAR